MLIRSKWPSIDGVGSQPEMPPASLTGPVWTASMPISSKAAQRSSDPSAPRNDCRGAVISESG